MQRIQLSPLQTFWRGVKMIVQAAPVELRYLILLTLISGAAPATTLFLNKLIIDEATRLLGQGAIANPLEFILQEPLLLGSIGGLILLNLVTDALDTIKTFVFTTLRDRVQGFVQERVLEKVANFADIALFETPELLNLVQLAEKGVQRLQRLSMIVITNLNGLFTFIPAVLLSGSIAWWVPLILFSSAAPSIYVEIKYRKQSWRVEKTQAGTAREMNIYKDVLIGAPYAKELRLFGLQSLLLERWQGLFRQIFRGMQQIRRQGTSVVIAWSMVSGLGAALPYVYVVMGVLSARYTVGDLALYAGLILQVRRSLYLLISSSADLYDVILGTTPIFQLLELKSQLNASVLSANNFNLPLKQKTATEDGSGIEIRNLSFVYPGHHHQILNDISLKIKPQETIALVGENGAGKTTLAKLLCRLYDPTEGKILWHGQDIRQLELEEFYSRLGVVMQDYARFPATMRENVGFGYLPWLQENNQIEAVIEEAGMKKVIKRLERGLETPLGRQLEGGIDLSGGQWQRVAIARSLMRLDSAELLIFDEPTAALDPKTEHEIYNIFRTIAANKMAVVISHRLALAKQADRIVVLENGKIIEIGTHDELVELEGQYALMFARQASSYK